MENKKTQGHERLVAFFDAGTFVELCAYVRRPDSEDAEGVVCGYGAKDGRLVFAFAQDSSQMKGALDGRHADKIVAVYEKALSVGAPVVGFFDCAGAVVFDGATALAAYGKLLAAANAARGRIPQIAVICGACVGTMAAVAASFDIVIAAADKARLYVSSPSLVGDEVGTAAYLAANATVALAAENEAAAAAKAGELLTYFPDRVGAPVPVCETDNLNRALHIADGVTAKDALLASVDAGRFQPLYAEAAEAVTVGLAGMGGLSCVVLALDGMLALADIKVMCRALKLANGLGLPAVTFVNCEGIKQSAEDEAGLPDALSSLACLLCEGHIPHITAIVGAAFGAGFLFGGAKTMHADLVLALPGARISALTPEAGVAFLWNDRITATLTREMLQEQWRAAATPEAAATTGEIDDIVDPVELRARILAGLMMLRGKHRHPVAPPPCHGRI